MTSSMTRLRACLPLLAVALVRAACAESPGDFAATVPLTAQGSEALQRIELPVDVYANVLHADLRDVRIFNAAGEPVPFAFVGDAVPAPQPPETYSPPVFPVWGVPGKRIDQLDVRIEQRADGTLTSIRTVGAPPPTRTTHPINYIIDASAIALPIAVMRPQWETPPENYVGTARVEASDDLKSWRTLVADASLVYLVQGSARLSQDRILTPPTRAKYFRVTFGSNAPLLVDMQLDAPALRGEPRRQSVRVAGRVGAKPNEIDYDVGVRAPVDRVRIVVRETNALAPVRLESRADPKAPWRTVVSSIAYRLVRDGRDVASPDLAIAISSHPEWRLVIDPASGGLGTPPPDLEVSWPARHLVFLARGAGPFLLAAGNKDAAVAALPISSLMPGYRADAETTLPVAMMGEVRKTPPPAPPLFSNLLGGQEPRKIGLWAALILGVAILAVMAWRLSRQMQRGGASGDAERTPD
jgi:hypothetical protein